MIFSFLKRFKKPVYIRLGISKRDKEKVIKKWKEIEELVSLGSPSRYKTAIIEADKLVDFILTTYGYKGKNLGEKIKSIPRNKYPKEFFTNLWKGHLLRNKIVHDLNYEIHSSEAKDIIKRFKKVIDRLIK